MVQQTAVEKLKCLCYCISVHFAELLSRDLEVDVCEEELPGAMDIKLSSFQISPISSNNVSNTDIHNCATLTDADVNSGHNCIDQHLLHAGDYRPDCNETDDKFTSVDDVLTNASNANPRSSLSSCESPITNLV